MPPFNNPKVVQAVNYAIDRKTILKTIFGNIGKVSYQAFPRGYVGYSEAAANLYPYDPAKAKALLAAAGYCRQPAVVPDHVLRLRPVQGARRAAAVRAERRRLPDDARRPAARPGRARPCTSTTASRSTRTASPAASRRCRCSRSSTPKDGLLNPCRCAPVEADRGVRRGREDADRQPEVPGAAAEGDGDRGRRRARTSSSSTQPWVYARSTKVQGLQPYLVAQRFEGVYVAVVAARRHAPRRAPAGAPRGARSELSRRVRQPRCCAIAARCSAGSRRSC